ncbi:PH domain-containing protein [Actinoplanes flavus]|uniref:PH domain-containing protein n=1 Tax=Actinoplanes flavus TaxID=2820290 RepID=A0ABS3URT7_9ACTN|nr:PH domain-containing protein [Actinoplanes flavus]MBO3740808.1 PH domain-containing protein [Actinoplanes flavus]
MGSHWVRPYTPGNGRWLVILWEAVALALLTWASIRQFDLIGHGVRAVACTLAAVWVIGAWRILRHGVYVSSDGVLIRGLLRSRSMRWHDIAGVHLHQSIHKLGRWELQNDTTVLIERHDGATVNTELWARGVDFHSRPKLFRAVYQEIRNRHRAAAEN